MNILLVDDEKELVSTLAQRLEFRGFNADWAASGNQALENAQTRKYDVAVLDIKMPGIGGIELGRELKKILPEIRIIFCTGYGQTKNLSDKDSMQDNENIYLSKPVDINILIEKLNMTPEK
jgi:CheY-like chemotaxis protein